jgi:hypothetical protein
MDNVPRCNTSLIFKKLQILYTYSQHSTKTFKLLLEEMSIHDKDCAYALHHQTEFHIIKLL